MGTSGGRDLKDPRVMNYESPNNVICQSFNLEYNLDCRKRGRALLRRLGRQQVHILDVGSGSGNYLLTNGGGTRDFLCLDSSRPALTLLRQKTEKLGKPQISFLQADAQRTPLRNDVFDGIIAGDIMEHLPRDVDFLVEMTRTLKPQGILVLSVPHGEKLTPFDIRAGHIRRYKADTLTKLTHKVGLIPIEIAYWGFPVIKLYDEFVSLYLRRNGGEGFASRADVKFLKKMAKSRFFRLYLMTLPFLEKVSHIDDFLRKCTRGAWLILCATKING